VSLDSLLESNSDSLRNHGSAFLRMMESRGKSVGLRPPLTGDDVRNELRKWRNKELTAPTLQTRRTK
jgi:hypothetical protein